MAASRLSSTLATLGQLIERSTHTQAQDIRVVAERGHQLERLLPLADNAAAVKVFAASAT